MIIILNSNKPYDSLLAMLGSKGIKASVSQNKNESILLLEGNLEKLDLDHIKSFECVSKILSLEPSYKQVSRKHHKENTIVDVCGIKFGSSSFPLIAGPCAIESREQILSIATNVKKQGANLLRGGAYKPRTSPYSFQGLGKDGLKFLYEAKEKTGLGIVSEIMTIDQIEDFKDVDLIQVGARNMQNFELLKALGRLDKPILLKRNRTSSIEDMLLSAEYILNEGNSNVILCERGIRSLDPLVSNNVDIIALATLKELTHLPVILDPSHSAAKSRFVEPLSLSGAIMGADGLIIEVHDQPELALCDGKQAILSSEFGTIVKKLDSVLPLVNKTRC